MQRYVSQEVYIVQERERVSHTFITPTPVSLLDLIFFAKNKNKKNTKKPKQKNQTNQNKKHLKNSLKTPNLSYSHKLT